MEILDEKVIEYVEHIYTKWNECGMFSECVEYCENFRQFEKWWYDEFLEKMPEEHDDYDEDTDGYYGIDKMYSVEEFFGNDLELFSKCIKFVHNYYAECENVRDYTGDDTHTPRYGPKDIMNDYFTIYVVNNNELIKKYIPQGLLVDMEKTLLKPSPV